MHEKNDSSKLVTINLSVVKGFRKCWANVSVISYLLSNCIICLGSSTPEAPGWKAAFFADHFTVGYAPSRWEGYIKREGWGGGRREGGQSGGGTEVRGGGGSGGVTLSNHFPPGSSQISLTIYICTETLGCKIHELWQAKKKGLVLRRSHFQGSDDGHWLANGPRAFFPPKIFSFQLGGFWF